MNGTLRGKVGMCRGEPAAHFVGLPECKRAAAGTDTNFGNCHHSDRTPIRTDSPQNLHMGTRRDFPAGVATGVEFPAALR